MRKALLRFACTIILLIFIISGCQKNQSANKDQKDFTHIDLVPEQVAKSVAEKFNPATFFPKDNNSPTGLYNSTLNGNNRIKNELVFKDASGFPAFYVFNFEDNAGFVFVSADYKIRPILGFVEHGEFKHDAAPSAFIEWGNKTKENTEIVRQGLYDNTRLAVAEWKDYLKKTGLQNVDITTAGKLPPIDPGCQEGSNTIIVGPLLPVTWGQACSYNELCPLAGCTTVCPFSTNVWTGCVATAMSQVIRYWQPANGYGYNYAAMPATFGNGEVQRLMHDAGTNVGMSYGCNASGADGGNVPGALKNHFGFTSANRISYDIGTYSRVQSNLSSHWPVLLEGCSTRTNVFLGIIYSYSDCHEWVCDGYNETSYTWCNPDGSQGGATYLYFHMNWGWHETWGGNDFSGWFGFDNWNIPGRSLNFQYARDAVTEIHP